MAGVDGNEKNGGILNTFEFTNEGDLGEIAKVAACDSFLEHDTVMIDETENSSLYKNEGKISEGLNGNQGVVNGVQAVEKLSESYGAETLGDDVENVAGQDNVLVSEIKVFEPDITRVDEGFQFSDWNRRSGFDSDGISSVFENLNEQHVEQGDGIELEKTVNAGETKEVCDDADKRVMIESQVFETEIIGVEDNYESSNGNGESDFPENGSGKMDENGAFPAVNLDGKRVENCDKAEIEKAGKEGGNAGGETCGDDDKGLMIKSQAFESEVIRVAENFGSSHGNGGLVFSENGLDKVEHNGTSFVHNFNEQVETYGSAEQESDEENVQYSVGDFVWSKFNSHPWWPAQIYDPSDASDHAKKLSQRGKRLLVAYFGDGSFSWRSSSQLKPFAENFDELSKKSDAPIFLTSVENALDEIGRVAELKMTCPCISEENKTGLVKQTIANDGIKQGVAGAECVFSRLPVSDFNPTKLISELKSIAKANRVNSMLELRGFRSCLSAFYRFKGCRKLTLYYEGVRIEGLQKKTRKSRDLSVMQKCVGLSANKLKPTGKSKSVAMLMQKDGPAEPNVEKKTSIKKVRSTENDDDESHEKDVDENAGCVLEGEAGGMTASRKRKKSRFLSYPYIDLNVKSGISRSKRDLAAESVKISNSALVGERMASAAAKLTQSSPILKKKLSEESEDGGDISALSDPGTQGEKKIIEHFKVEGSPNKVVSLVRSAALDPLLDSDSHDMVRGFISAYRSVVYKSAPSYKHPSKKRKSLSSKSVLGVKDQIENHDLEMNIAELKKGLKKKKKKAKKIIGEVTDNEGLLFIKHTLEKVTLMVKNCDGDMPPETKLSVETELKGLLGKVRIMGKTTSS